MTCNHSRLLTALVLAAAAGIGSAHAASDLPRLKAGMWAQYEDDRLNIPDAPIPAEQLNKALAGLTSSLGGMRFCIDDAVQTQISVFGGPDAGVDCQAPVITKTAASFEAKLACSKGGIPLDVRVGAYGDFAKIVGSHFHIDVGGGRFKADKADAFVYLGPCTGGLQPGEINIPGIGKGPMASGYPPAF